MKVRAIGKSAIYEAIQATWNRGEDRITSMMAPEPFVPGCECDYEPMDAESACCGATKVGTSRVADLRTSFEFNTSNDGVEGHEAYPDGHRVNPESDLAYGEDHDGLTPGGDVESLKFKWPKPAWKEWCEANEAVMLKELELECAGKGMEVDMGVYEFYCTKSHYQAALLGFRVFLAVDYECKPAGAPDSGEPDQAQVQLPY